jgi:hypothetical protein
MKTFLPFLLLLSLGCASSKPTEEQLANAGYGPAPENYREIVTKWIEDNYGNINQSGIRNIRIGQPTKGYMNTGAFGGGDLLFGYLVEVSFEQVVGTGRRATTDRYLFELLLRDGAVAEYKEERL